MRYRLTRADVFLFFFAILMMALLFLLSGCAISREQVDTVTGSAASGAISGATIGGPMGALIGGGLGLVAGLGRAFQVGRQKRTVLADVTRGVGSFLDDALDPSEFKDLNAQQAVDLAKQRLRDCLQQHFTDFTRDQVRQAKDANG